MVSPRKRKVKKYLIGTYVNNAGLSTTGILAANDASLLSASLADPAVVGTSSAAGYFANASTALLTDGASDGDGNFSNAGVAPKTGEPTDFSGETVSHFKLSLPGEAAIQVSATNWPVIIYSPDGPSANSHKTYSSWGLNATASIGFDNQVTGSVNEVTHLQVYYAGTLHSNSLGYDKLEIYAGAGPSLVASVSGTNEYVSGNLYIETASIGGSGFLMATLSSSADQTNTDWLSGFLVHVSGTVGTTTPTGSAWTLA